MYTQPVVRKTRPESDQVTETTISLQGKQGIEEPVKLYRELLKVQTVRNCSVQNNLVSYTNKLIGKEKGGTYGLKED